MSLRKRIPTSARVALAVTGVLVVGVSALSLIAFVATSHRLAAETDRTLRAEADAYAAAVGSQAALGSSEGLATASRAYISARTAVESGSHPLLLVKLPSGEVLSNGSVPLDAAPADAKLLSGGTLGLADVSLRNDAYRVYVLPVQGPSGQVLGVFEAALSRQPANDVASQLAWTLLASGAGIVLVGAALSAFVAQGSLRPLRRAAGTAGEVTMASLGQRIDYDGADDEVGRMVRALNAMLARLEASFDEQRHFVADASHELRTPLAIVRGHLELLGAGTLSGEDREHAFGVVFSEIDRMNRLVDDLLALARLDVGQMRELQPVELTTLAAEAAAKGRPLSGCTIESTGRGQVWVHGDPDGLMQAVLNLVRNAVAVTPENGRIVVSARREGTSAVMEVSDTGPGIRASDLPRIFDRFYRAPGTKRSDGGGSGLGLAITKRLVELHGGTITARNRGEGGAVFRIELPGIEAPRGAASDAA